jgi:hypothetical protein
VKGSDRWNGMVMRCAFIAAVALPTDIAGSPELTLHVVDPWVSARIRGHSPEQQMLFRPTQDILWKDRFIAGMRKRRASDKMFAWERRLSLTEPQRARVHAVSEEFLAAPW